MYLRRINIENIRSIKKLNMSFPQSDQAGWHVLIGDNGSGKSTIVKAISLALLDLNDILATRENWENWLGPENDEGKISLEILRDKKYDFDGLNIDSDTVNNKIKFKRYRTINDDNEPDNSDLESDIFSFKVLEVSSVQLDEVITGNTLAKNYQGINRQYLNLRKGAWFSVAYGPYRRFSGGAMDKENLYKTHPRLGAHLSVFSEDVALTEALSYLKELHIQDNSNKINNSEKNSESKILEGIIKFINISELLPHNSKLDQLSINQVTFKDANNQLISANQMSDGYRSVLSMIFELIRQLIIFYGHKAVFNQINQNNMVIDLPGVVIIDEIDTHLHPTWQTRIGDWFTKYFPKIQFIVTTHSPLVCRAAVNGSIWRLAKPGSNQCSEEITGLEKEKLIYGNILDAYGTELFGSSPVRSEKSSILLDKLGSLNIRAALGKITESEEIERLNLQKLLSTDDPINF